jgi:hypothetical protein
MMRAPIGIALIISVMVLCVPSSLAESRTEEAETPLLADFRAFCVDTQVRLEAISTIPRRAGAEPETSINGWIGHSGPAEVWEHSLGGHRIRIQAGVGRSATDGPADQSYCIVKDFSDKGASFFGMQRWLGTPAESKNFFQYYEFTMLGGRPHLLQNINKFSAKSAGVFSLTAVNIPSSTSLTLTKPLLSRAN